jgi:hypothetical protein
MNNRLVVTASWDKTARVYDADCDYSCTAVLDWFHNEPVRSVALIGDDHILSALDDTTVCITQMLSSRTVVAHTKMRHPARCAAVLLEGRLAVCSRTNSLLIDAPAAAADILKAHSAVALPEDAASVLALALAEPLPPLQGALVRVAAGALTAAAACRDIIAAYACSASLAECAAAHSLFDAGDFAKAKYEGI